MWIRIVQHEENDACVTRFVISLTTEREIGGRGGGARVLETMNRRKNTMFMIYEFRVQGNRDCCAHLAPLSDERRNLSTAHSISVKRDSQWPGKSRYYVILLVPTFSPFLSIFAIAARTARERNDNEVSTGFTLFHLFEF